LPAPPRVRRRDEAGIEHPVDAALALNDVDRLSVLDASKDLGQAVGNLPDVPGRPGPAAFSVRPALAERLAFPVVRLEAADLKQELPMFVDVIVGSGEVVPSTLNGGLLV
jgi:hypothetical protein